MQRFSQQRADRAINFLTKIVHRPNGERYRPVWWQYQAIRDVYGLVDRDGKRQVRVALLLLPKKNGKSEFSALNALYMAFGDGYPDATVYLAAASRDQTKSVFAPAAKMAQASPLLAPRVVVNQSTKIIHRAGDPMGNYIRALSADGDKADGIKVYGAVIDELHRWKEPKAKTLYEVLQGGRVSVPEPLIWIISTAGEMDESPLLWPLYEYAKNIQAGVVPPDPSFYFKIFEAEPGDDIYSPDTWRKANPSLEIEDPELHKEVEGAGLHPGFIRVSELEELARQAKALPHTEPAFKRLHLNIWNASATAESAYMLEEWKLAETELRPLFERPCYAGLDLSATRDLSSLTLIFPDENGEEDLISFSWMPEDRVREAVDRDHVPYDIWARTMQRIPLGGGQLREWPLLDITEGNIIDYSRIVQRIAVLKELFSIQALGYDPKFATETMKQITDLGINTIQVNQGATTTSEPFQSTIRKVAGRKIRHNGNQLFSWAMANARIKTFDDNLLRLVKPDRQKTSKRIDPISAWICAEYCRLKMGPQTPGEVLFFSFDELK